ncbi:ribosome-binding protein 1 isoform X1 [Astyanax mexicanus]|uniref:Ribosome-binding protein 1 isoform X1 n=1 Tax=Astyanax mexicanus TaxID=7994 RepID=A0A8T2LTR0_ASTMX|nr:ribosome-binding protein 1 isoform X1 [Astyanax mexicanus]
MMDIYDPQTLGIVVFGGFMVISAIGIALVSTFSMKETSYEEALAKQRQELAKTQPQQRTEKKKKDKTAEKKNHEKKKKDEKPGLKSQESETGLDENEEASDHQASSPLQQTQKPESMLDTAPATKPAPATAAKAATATKPTPAPAVKPASATATKAAPVLAASSPALAQVSAPAEAPAAPSPKDKKKKEKKVAKVESAQTQTQAPPAAVLESVVREVPVMAVPPVESQKSVPVVEASAKAEKPKLAAPSKKKSGSKKSTESGATVDTVDAPLYLPYSTVLSTLKSMVFSESEAQQLMEILSDSAGVQDSWHTATQKGDPVAVLKKQLEEKEKQMATAQEEASSAKNRLRELSKELSAEKSKVALVETRLSSQLSKREQEMIALQARMQASYQDHLAETQQLNAKVGTLQDQLEKGPNAQLARLQQENSILRDALNKATSQVDSKQNAELAKLWQDCARLNKDLGEKIEALHSEEQLRKSLESKASVAEKQLCQLQACRVSSEQALQRRLEEVSEELRKAQSSSSSLQTQLTQAQQDNTTLTETRGHLAALEAELGERTGQVESLKVQLSQTDLENQQLQEQLGSVRVLLEASQSRAKEEEPNTEALVSELQEAGNRDDKNQITSLQEELSGLKEELEELRSAANNKTAEHEHLQYSSKLKDDQISSLQSDLEQFKQHLDQSKLENTTQFEHLQNSVKDREARIHSLEEELKQYKECDTNVGSADDLRAFQTDTISVLQSLFPQLSINTEEDKWLHEFSEKAQESLSATQHSLESQQNKVTELLGRLSEAQESQSTLQADCEQYRTVLAETEGMLKTLQRSVEEEETGWRAKVSELEEQLRRSLQKVQVLEDTAQTLRAENQNTEQLKQLLSESESQLQSAQREAHSHREELEQVRQQLSRVMDGAEKGVENGQPETQSHQVQVKLEQTVQTLQAEQALKLQLSEEVEQAHRTVAELQLQVDQLKAVGETPSATEDVAELKERLEKERKLTKDLGQAATKLQQLLRTSQDQLANQKELVRILQDKLQEKDEDTEAKDGTSV